MIKSIPPRAEDYSLWYNTLVKKAGLAENSSVRGCMIIKPYGFAIWEKMQQILDKMFKDTGHSNAYFPLFIPKSHLSKEANHVDGFAKECAVVTHYRLKNSEDNSGIMVDPEAKLEEELIVRPTSETVIWDSYKRWIQSYRDLPLLLNQWANVVRWEMRTRLFLRTSEFLWQEGHTAHATEQEAIEESIQMLDIYASFVEDYMAIPVTKGKKTESERFAGAVETYCIETMMQDAKALQAGTSHFLGQNFAKAFDVKFANKKGKEEYVWGTSWGVSTRLMGALVMSHSDDRGLVLPPKLAPIQVVIVPIYKGEEEFNKISAVAKKIMKELQKVNVSVKYDDRDTHKPGWKFSEYELKGVPIRMVIGPRDIENNTVEIARRDTGEKNVLPTNNLPDYVSSVLKKIQSNIFQKAQNFKKEHTKEAHSVEEFKQLITHHFVYAYWNGTTEIEQQIKEETKATIRCVPLQNNHDEKGTCIFTGKPSKTKVLFARAY